jgi:hypothetical protein
MNMNTLSLASASVAAVMAIAVLDAAPAQARHGGASFSGSHTSFSARSSMGSSFKPHKLSTSTTMRRSVGITPRIKHVTKVDKAILKKTTSFRTVQNGTLKSGNLHLAKLPVLKTASGKAGLLGRLSVPKNLKPKLTLAHAPSADFKLRLAPFVQRHWKTSFFWVAVAGFGYLTVPELYYERFNRCSGVADTDYEECIRVLSYAVIEEEQQARRVHYAMPAGAVYRYRAKVEPTVEARQTCSFEPFVERKWNREFVWVEIPQTGNVTVPEEIYDKFAVKVDGEPPDYTAACKVLTEAAAADTVVATTAMDLERRL